MWKTTMITNKKQIKYYQDFITIGLKREPCNEC